MLLRVTLSKKSLNINVLKQRIVRYLIIRLYAMKYPWSQNWSYKPWRINSRYDINLCMMSTLIIMWFQNQMLPGKISITFDTWTSRAFDPYIAITAHYINSSTNSQSLWVLKKDLIGFFPVIGSHSGENLACYIIECVEWFGLEKKVRKKIFISIQFS